MKLSSAGGEVTLLTETLDPESMGAVRGRVRETAERNGLTGLELTKFVLVAHELALNAMRYGRGRRQVHIWRDATSLWCEVIDHGPGIPRQYVNGQGSGSEREITGWGLRLVRLICADVRIETRRGCTQITIRYPVLARPASPST